jgi:DNA-binding transcriptional regulator LsrR (DeoR family)
MNRIEIEPTLLDQAARAGWLYYVAGMTQDQIAAELGVSRQRAQRLVSRARDEGLIHVRLEHKIGACLELEADLTRRFQLAHVRVAPGLGAGADPNRAIAGPAAALLEHFLRQPDPLIVALGTGRALRAMVDEMTRIPAEHHRIVSLIGNIAPDGSATMFDVIMRVAEKLMAPHYPMPVPVISDTAEERAFFMHLRPIQNVVALAEQADVTFVGIGQMGADAPLYKDGFVTLDVLHELQARGAAGEIVSWVYDSEGHYIDSPRNALVGGVRIEAGRAKPVVGVAAGASKVDAIRAALNGRIVNGLVTDETTAKALLG